MKKIIVIIALLTGPFACNPVPCGGEQVYLNITNQASDIAGVDSSGESIEFSEVTIDIEMKTESDMPIINQDDGKGQWVPFANACSPPPPILLQKISKIVVTSSTDYNNDFPAGADLFELFMLETDFYVESPPGSTFPMTLNDWNPILNLNLQIPPSGKTTHTFSVTVFLDNGTNLGDQTSELEIIP